MSARIPDWLVERYALDELPPQRRAEVEAALAERPERLAELQASDAEILRRLPPRAFATEVHRRAGLSRRRARWGAGLAVMVPLAAALLLSVRPPEPVLATDGGEEIRDKGDQQIRDKGDGPYLVLHRQQGEAPERLADGDAARPGDVLQLGYASLGRKHGVILSVDGRGAVTLHHPAAGADTALAPEGTAALPEAFRLDDAPAFERFYLVTSDDPLDPAAVVRRAEAGALRPAPGEAIHTLTLRKLP